MRPLTIDGIKKDLYLVEEDGRIYSKKKHRYLTPRKDKDGYLIITLQRAEGGAANRICKRLAPLIALTFIGPPPNTMLDPTINHIDGNKENNHYSNLEWLERGKNSKIRKKTGKGEENSQAVLTDKEIIEICELLIHTELTLQEIGDRYNVQKSTISNIALKKNWAHLTKNYDFSCRKIIRDSATGRYKTINTNLNRGGK